MWGICLDISLCEEKLFQRAIEYKLSSENNKAIILQPFSEHKIDVNKIKSIVHTPKYTYGDCVCHANHTDRKGKIIDIIWHFKNQTFNYYIEVDNKKVSKRYYENDLIKF